MGHNGSKEGEKLTGIVVILVEIVVVMVERI